MHACVPACTLYATRHVLSVVCEHRIYPTPGHDYCKHDGAVLTHLQTLCLMRGVCCAGLHVCSECACVRVRSCVHGRAWVCMHLLGGGRRYVGMQPCLHARACAVGSVRVHAQVSAACLLRLGEFDGNRRSRRKRRCELHTGQVGRRHRPSTCAKRNGRNTGKLHWSTARVLARLFLCWIRRRVGSELAF